MQDVSNTWFRPSIRSMRGWESVAAERVRITGADNNSGKGCSNTVGRGSARSAEADFAPRGGV